MTTRNLEALFAPRSIALVGASARPGSVGDVLAGNLSAAGFDGELMFVSPRGGQIRGREVRPTVAALPLVPDLAVIATPAETVPLLIAELGARGCRAAVVISAGFEADDPAAVGLRQALLDAAHPHLLRIVGPNCLGVLSPAHGVNASFARVAPPPGRLALIAQSGAVAAAALDWAPAHGLGFSHVATLGDSLEVDAADLLDYLGADAATGAILIYLESVRHARKFVSAARQAARAKPVVLLKGGRSAAGAAAAFSHTRALAGADVVYAAAFRRAGILQVETLEDLLDAGLVFAGGRPTGAGDLAILTNGGGAGVLAVDALARCGGGLAQLSPATQAALKAALPAHGVVGNPVDILGDAGPGLYQSALGILLDAPEVDAALAINCPTAVADSTAAAEAVVAAREAGARKPVIAAWLGEPSVAAGRARLAGVGVPTFATPEAAVRSFASLGAAQRLHDILLEAPDCESARDAARVRRIVASALAQGRQSLDAAEIHQVLTAYGVPSVEARMVRTPAEAGAAAASMAPAGPVALKIQSRDISHKSDVGGVALNLMGDAEVAQSAREMSARIAAACPAARLEGFVVQPMISRPKAQEVLVGVARDPTFGPVVVFGQGGVAVEAIGDRALGLPPLNRRLARDVIGQTRVARLLAGYRDRPAADLDAVAEVLVAVGRLATDIPQISELDLNPLLCDASGVVALDARIAIRADPGAPPAILPYPAELARQIEIDGARLGLRPIKPADAAALIEMIARCTSEDVRLRFCGGVRRLTDELAARLTQIDYDRQMALVAEDADGALMGVATLVEDPTGESAEFALIVRSDRQQRGIGHCLMQALIVYAESKGLRTLWGDVARGNERMLEVANSLGFVADRAPSDATRLRVVRSLRAPLRRR